jgi:hypothetical protein
MIHFNIAEILLIYWMVTAAFTAGFMLEDLQEHKWWEIILVVCTAFWLVPSAIIEWLYEIVKQLWESDDITGVMAAIKVLVFKINIWANWSNEEVSRKIKSVEGVIAISKDKSLSARLTIKTFNKLKQLNKHRL